MPGARAESPLAGPGSGYPCHPEGLPPGSIEQGRYRARFALRSAELDSILRLRFRVFNLEMGEGLEVSHRTGRDEDAFDLACHHLLVEDRTAGCVVGTYRMQSAGMAATGRGFYSAGEFDLSALPDALVASSVEVGRACICREHRNRQVLFLLWKGLARYMAANRKRYLFGCCSLSSQDSALGVQVQAQLAARGKTHPWLEVRPLAGFECPGQATPEQAAAPLELPSLFRTYLRYGGLVCSPPAIDRAFKTIDFLVLFDIQAMEPRTYRLFFD